MHIPLFARTFECVSLIVQHNLQMFTKYQSFSLHVDIAYAPSSLYIRESDGRIQDNKEKDVRIKVYTIKVSRLARSRQVVIVAWRLLLWLGITAG